MKDKRRYTELSLLLDKKLELFEGLIQLSRKQTGVIEAEKWDELQSLLDKKEVLMQKADKLEEELQPITEKTIENYDLNKDNWAEEIQGITEIPENIKDTVKKLDDRIRELRKIHNQNLIDIKGKRQELNEGMMKLQDGRRANKGYNNIQRVYSTFIDQKS
ncbi:MAG: flagellar protein FlgN [Firmicutes bacterium]|nr:flagellar protein FlgN [Bacillota bacterium]